MACIIGRFAARERVQRAPARVQASCTGAGDSGCKRVYGANRGPALRDWLLPRPGLPALFGRIARGWWRRSGNPRWTDTVDTA